MAGDATNADHLREYHEKRRLGATPEPTGAPAAATSATGGIFVVQKHAARRLHYDLRLEMGGVLRSWAVPKGPSPDPREKRLAVLVEDHPLEYADFEGLIPEGNYGAGAVIVWDRGRWRPEGDPGAGLEKGKLLFRLEGSKLRGLWALVRLRPKGARGKKARAAGGDEGRDWLLIKEHDAHVADAGAPPLPEESVLSGLTVEELRDGVDRAAPAREALLRAGAPRRPVRAADWEPMLAEPRETPFSEKGWLFEIKYDGFRLLAEREGPAPAAPPPSGLTGAVNPGPSRGRDPPGFTEEVNLQAPDLAAPGTALPRARLLYRRGNDATRAFPEIAAAIRALPYARIVLDGEVVVLDAEGRPSFQRLQRRFLLSREADIARAQAEHPAVYFVFDLLGLDDLDARPVPLEERKGLLRGLLPRLGPVRFADHVEERGEAVFAEARRLGLEGMIAKRSASPYRAGRSPDWLKVRFERTADLAIVGFTEPQGARTGFGALHLAAAKGPPAPASSPEPGPAPAEPRRPAPPYLYVGRVGTGFTERDLADIRAALEPIRCETPPCDGPLPEGRGHSWVEPRLACEVRYLLRTEDGLLRQPAFLRLRPDKRPEDCALPAEGDDRELEFASVAEDPNIPRPHPVDLSSQEPSAAAARAPAPADLPLSNTAKVFWPADGFTKGDLLAYYRAIAPHLLPYLRDRPAVLTRYPDGIEGKSFYQKDAPGFRPPWIRTERVYHKDPPKPVDYFVLDDLPSLLYVVNLGAIPLHIWSSRAGAERLERPDWCLLDLDPKGAPFAHVVRVACAIRTLCEEIGLPVYVKTSGRTGLHVLIPLGAQTGYAESRTLAELLARLVTVELPGIATIVRPIEDRGGRVYIDYLQNRAGQLLVAPFGARPLPGAPVSMPLDWDEVTEQLDPRAFTIATAPGRMAERAGRDPLRPVLDERPDLGAALARLSKRVGPGSPE